ncbi:MAG: NADPH:quinone oxidoreductase family protein [Kiloniellales bacterium]
MKAIQVAAFGPLESHGAVDLPEPEPAAGEVLVEVACCDLNYPDILVMEGNYQVKPALPFIPGKAAAGRIVGLGAAVEKKYLGQRVLVQLEHGAFAERITAPLALTHPIPKALSYRTATALGLVYQTAWFALTDRGGFRAGERVLVLGANGGVGMAAVQLAKAMGAGQVIAGARGEEKIALARSFGADAVIDLSAEPLKERLRAQVKEASGGAGVDIVIDPVGGDNTEAALRALAWRGRLVVIGFAAGDIPTIRANYLLVKNIAVSGLQWSDYRDRHPGWMAKAQAEIFAHALAGRLTPHISRVLPLERAIEGLDLLRKGGAVGKILVTTGSGEPE